MDHATRTSRYLLFPRSRKWGRLSRGGVLLLLPVCAASGFAAGETTETDARWPLAWTMFDFDRPAQLSAWNLRSQTQARLVPSPWAGRGKALELVFEPLPDGRRHWPAAICAGDKIPLPARPELYHYLIMRVKNEGRDKAFFYLHFRNKRGGRFSTPHAPQSWTLEPEQEQEVVFPLRDLVQAMPLSTVREFHLVTDTPPTPFRLVIDDIRLAPGLAQQAEEALDALRRVRRLAALNAPRGPFRERMTKRLAALDQRLAELRGNFSSRTAFDSTRIATWEKAMEALRTDVSRAENSIRVAPGKERARQAIARLGVDDDWIVGEESAMVKVAWEALPFLGQFGRPLRLDGARGETVHGQVVIVPTATDLRGVTWKASGLVGPSAARIPMRVRVVGFLRTSRPGSYDVPYVGWWPDPLLEDLHRFDVPAFAQQPLWITVDIPRDAKPGPYRGRVEIAVSGRRLQHVAVELRVRSFALPLRRHLRLAVNYEEREVARIYGKRWNDALKWRYRNFLLQHRFNVDSIYQILPMWDETVADLKRLKAGGQDFITVAVFNNTNAPGWQAHVRAFRERAEAAGVADRCWFYGFDESPVSLRKDILYHAAACHRLWPGAHVMTTASPELMRDPSLRKVIDAWVIGTGSYERFGDQIETVRKEGGQAWYYVCVGPHHPYANLFIEYPAVEQRLLLGFMAWKSRTDGFLYYSLNRAPKNDRPLAGGPLCDWNPASYDDYNGDGCLFYVGGDGPVSTIRFENMRDGIEDYEVCWLLRNLLQRVEGETDWADAHRQILARARRAAIIPADVVRTLSDYTLSPDRIDRYRRALYDAVDELTGAW